MKSDDNHQYFFGIHTVTGPCNNLTSVLQAGDEATVFAFDERIRVQVMQVEHIFNIFFIS